MKNKPPRDERIQLIYYKAGYYAFMVTFPMMVLTFLLFASDGTKDSIWAPISVLVTFWTGIGIMVIYPWRKKVGEAEREIIWQNPAKAIKHRKLRLVTFPLVMGLFILFEYLGKVYLEQKEYHFSEEYITYVIVAIMWLAIMYFTEFRKPKHLRGNDGED